MKNKHILFFIFFLSIGLRLFVFNNSKAFGTDQARDVLLVQKQIAEKKLIVLGPKASAGNFSLPPFYYYLISIPWLISQGNPYSPALFNIILESFTPLVIYLLVKKYWDKRTAISASLLYAISPLVINFSTFAWNPNVIPFFSSIFLYFFFDYVINNKGKSLIIASLFAAITLNLHFQGFILFFPLFLMFIYSVVIEKRSIKPWIYSLAASLLLFIPLLSDTETSFQNIRNIIQYFSDDHRNIYQTTFTFEFFWHFMSRMYSLLLGFRHSGYLFGRIVLFLGTAIVGVKGLVEFISKKKITSNTLFTIFVIGSFIGLRVYKGDKLEYFLSFMYFIPAITLAISSHYLLNKKAIYVIILAAFSSGISFPFFVRSKSDDVAMINIAKKEAIERYGNSYSVKNYNEYYENSLEYLWYSDIEKKEDAENHLVICPRDYECSIAQCNNKGMPEVELNKLLDTYVINDSWRVKKIYLTSFRKK